MAPPDFPFPFAREDSASYRKRLLAYEDAVRLKPIHFVLPAIIVALAVVLGVIGVQVFAITLGVAAFWALMLFWAKIETDFSRGAREVRDSDHE